MMPSSNGRLPEKGSTPGLPGLDVRNGIGEFNVPPTAGTGASARMESVYVEDAEETIHLMPSLRTNLPADMMAGMPTPNEETQWRERARNGELWNGDELSDGVLWDILILEPKDRKPFSYLFFLADEHLEEAMERSDKPVSTISPTELIDVERFRKGVLALALINSNKDREWFTPTLTELEYRAVRGSVKHPGEHNIFDYCRELAEERPIQLKPDGFGVSEALLVELQYVASIAYHLHIKNDGSVKMPTKFVGAMWGLRDGSARNCGSKFIKALVAAGLLKQVKPHVPNERVAEYRFMVNRTDLYSPPS